MKNVLKNKLLDGEELNNEEKLHMANDFIDDADSEKDPNSEAKNE